jgi:2-desacetyl-2-hydroxyethyl bacteriochlorophyllide A dehydrogenase
MNSELMDVVVCERPGDVVAARRPIPVPREDEVLVRVQRVGICGTDMHIIRGTQPYLSYPRIMGHEVSGIVEVAPPGATVRAGDAVYIVPYLSCGECRPCKSGKPNCCRRIEVLGVHRDGALASFISVPERSVFRAEGISLDDAAMIEFLAIGAHAARRGDVGPGQRVLVSGAGPIGIACALFARLRGAEVTVLDTRADRLAVCAGQLRIPHTLTVSAQTAQQLEALTQGDMFDVVFDATGNASAMQAGFSYVAHGGTYVFVSIVPADITFSDPEFHKREMTLKGSRNATADDFAHVHRRMLAGTIPLNALRTHRATLLEFPGIAAQWMNPDEGVIKGLVEC